MSNRQYRSVTESRTFAEFFAGIGLMRMGLEKAGWQIAYANDIDPRKKAQYAAQFPDADRHFVLGDVHHLQPDEVPTVSLATASFPCTDLSLAGGQAGLGGKQSSAFWGFIEILRGLGARKPALVLLENVLGFVTSKKGACFREALLALNSLGYSVDAILADARHFVPQSRVRVFVVGSLQESISPVQETPSFCESEARPKAIADFILMNPDIRWSIRDLPPFPKRDRTLGDIVEPIPFDDAVWWDERRKTYLLNQMSDKHRTAAEEMIRGDTWSFGTVFRRVRNGRSMAELRTDGLAGCLRTPKGGSAKQILFVAGKGEYHVRLLVPVECARLMGAGEFHITGTPDAALFGFGDAVCVPVVRWIAENYLAPLFDELLASKSPNHSTRRDRLAVESIESFEARNIEEMGTFQNGDIRSGLKRLIETYNCRVDKVELDKSLSIDMPCGLA